MKKLRDKLKTAAAIALCAVLCAGLAGCAGSFGSSVIVTGSTSVQPLTKELAKGFMESERGIDVIVNSTDSSKAVDAISDSSANIGALSREPVDGEMQSVKNKYTIAIDGVAVIVNKDVEVSDLSLSQLKKIFTGEIKNWSEVGGQDKKITVVSREAGSGTREVFAEKTGVYDGKTDRTTKSAAVRISSYKVVKTVASKQGSIGYISLAQAGRSVRTLRVNGVMPTVKTVRNGDYLIQRPFIYIVGYNASAATGKFIKYVMSDDAQARLQERGYVTVK